MRARGDRRAGRGGSRDGDRAVHRSRTSCGSRPEDLQGPLARAAHASGGGGSSWQVALVCLTTPAWVETWKAISSACLPTTNSASRRRCRRLRPRRRCPAARRRTGERQRASSSPSIVRASRRSGSRTCAGSGHRWKRPSRRSSGPPSWPSAVPVDLLLEMGEGANTRCMASSASWPLVDAVPEPRHDRLPPKRVRTPVGSTSAMSSRVEFVPMSTTATRMSNRG